MLALSKLKCVSIQPKKICQLLTKGIHQHSANQNILLPNQTKHASIYSPKFISIQSTKICQHLVTRNMLASSQKYVSIQRAKMCQHLDKTYFSMQQKNTLAYSKKKYFSTQPNKRVSIQETKKFQHRVNKNFYFVSRLIEFFSPSLHAYNEAKKKKIIMSTVTQIRL